MSNTEYMLITHEPFFSSRSFHKTLNDVMDKIDEIYTLTDEWYDKRGDNFNPKPHPQSGDIPGIYIYKLYPDRPTLMRLIGGAKEPTSANLFEIALQEEKKYGLDSNQPANA